MGLFRILIWDKHEIEVYEDGDWKQAPHPDDNLWHKFAVIIETNHIRITSFREFVIFDPDGVPQRCVKVYLSDEEFLLARYSLEAFEKLYTEVYLPMVPKDLSDIVRDLEGDKPN